MLVLIVILSFSHPHHHFLFNNKLATQEDLWVPITAISPLIASFVRFPFTYISRLTLSNKQLLKTWTLPRGSRTLILIPRFRSPFNVLILPYLFHHLHPRGHRYDTKLDITD